MPPDLHIPSQHVVTSRIVNMQEHHAFWHVHNGVKLEENHFMIIRYSVLISRDNYNDAMQNEQHNTKYIKKYKIAVKSLWVK